jgi:hypothetical protein
LFLQEVFETRFAKLPEESFKKRESPAKQHNRSKHKKKSKKGRREETESEAEEEDDESDSDESEFEQIESDKEKALINLQQQLAAVSSLLVPKN